MRLKSPPLQGGGWVGMGFRRAGNDADFPGCAADAPSLDGWRTWGAAPVPMAQRCNPDGPGPRFGAGFAVRLDPLRSPLCSHRTRPARWAFFRGKQKDPETLMNSPIRSTPSSGALTWWGWALGRHRDGV